MYVNLTKETVDGKVTIGNVLDGDSVTVSDGTSEYPFTFKDSPSGSGQVQRTITEATAASGTVYTYNGQSPDNLDSIILEYPGQPVGCLFCSEGNGALCGVKFNNNPNDGDAITVSLGSEYEFVFEFGTNIQTEDILVNIYGTAGGTLSSKTTDAFRKAVNATLAKYGILARVFNDCVVLYKLISCAYDPLTNGKGYAHLTSTAAVGNSITIGTSSFVFGPDIPTGDSPEESALNLSNAINKADGFVISAAVGAYVYLFSKTRGSASDIKVTSNTASIQTSKVTGGTDSEVTATFAYESETESFTGLAVSSAMIAGSGSEADDMERCLASAAAALTSISDNFNFNYDNDSEKLTATSAEAGASWNVTIRTFGSNLTSTGMEDGADSCANENACAESLRAAIESLLASLTAAVSGNVVSISGSDLTLSGPSDSISVIGYSSGESEDDPMSWNELVAYAATLGTLSGTIRSNIDLSMIFLNGGTIKSSYNSLDFEKVQDSSVTLSSSEAVRFEQSINFLGCENISIGIEGRFRSNASDKPLVKIDDYSGDSSNSWNMSVTVSDTEYTQDYVCPLVSMNAYGNSTVQVSHSTHTTKSTASGNGTMYSLDGMCTMSSSYNVYESGASAVAIASLGTKCSASFRKDCIGFNTSYSGSDRYSATDCAQPEKDNDYIVHDPDNADPWSLNLANEIAMNIAYASAEADIYGNARGTANQHGTTSVTVSSSELSLTEEDYIQIGNTKKYFSSETNSDLPAGTYSSAAELASYVCRAFFDMPDVKITSDSNVIRIEGPKTTFSSNRSELFTSGFAYFTVNGSDVKSNSVDCGSRQKCTELSTTRYVDLSSSTSGDGTASNKYTLAQCMEELVTMFPMFGTLDYVMSGTNGTAVSFAVESDGNFPGYGTVKFSGSRTGKANVPVLEVSDISIRLTGTAKISFDAAMVHSAGTISGSETNTCELEVVNSILKAESTIDAKNGFLRILESTVQGTGTIQAAGRVCAKGSIFDLGTLEVVNGTLPNNRIVLWYNFANNDDGPITASVGSDSYADIRSSYGDGGACYPGGDFGLASYRLNADSGACKLIPYFDSLEETDASGYDITGELRSTEGVKASFDAGAYELNTAEKSSVTYKVNLGSQSDGYNTSMYGFYSLEEINEAIASMTYIDRTVEVKLYGYGNASAAGKLSIPVPFTDAGLLIISGHDGAFVDGRSLIDISSENKNVVIKDVGFRNDSSVIETSGSGTLCLISDLIINNSDAAANSVVSEGTEVKMYGVTFVGNSLSMLLSSDSNATVVGSVAQRTATTATDVLSVSGTITEEDNYCNNCLLGGTSAYADELVSTAISESTVTADNFYVEPEALAGAVTYDSSDSVMKEGYDLGWHYDLNGYIRFENDDKKSDPGCLDSLGIRKDSLHYDDDPNGQNSAITEEGSSLLSRLKSGKIAFKLIGYAIGKGGYLSSDPVLSLEPYFDGSRFETVMSVSSNDIEDGGAFTLGGTTYSQGTDGDFVSGDTVDDTIQNIADAINTKSGCCFAEVSGGTIVIKSITPGNYGSSSDHPIVTAALQSVISFSLSNEGSESTYMTERAYPSDGVKEFDSTQYLPLAILLLSKIERTEWKGGTGEMVVYAQITESPDLESEVDSIVPFAVVKHGLVTKDYDTVLVKRIVIQL